MSAHLSHGVALPVQVGGQYRQTGFHHVRKPLCKLHQEQRITPGATGVSGYDGQLLSRHDIAEITLTEFSGINPRDFPDQLHDHGITTEVSDQDLCGLPQHTDKMFKVFEMLNKLETAGQGVVVPEVIKHNISIVIIMLPQPYFLFIVPRTCMMLSLVSLLFWKAITGFSRILKQVLASWVTTSSSWEIFIED